MADIPSKAMLKMRRKPKQARSLKRVNRILDVAEDLFVREGYAAVTTKAIAAQAKVPIGSLYQFFPDKATILQALAERYTDLLSQRLQAFDTPEMVQISLSDYVDRLTDGTEQFFLDHPGYRATFMEVIASLPQVEDATDAKLIQTLAMLLQKRDASLSDNDYQAIAFVLVKAIGNLHWLSLGQKPPFRQRLLAETKQLSLSYLRSYFPDVPSSQTERSSRSYLL